jgi:hypothetical protein
VSICSRCFDLAPRRVAELELGFVNAFRLTQRAADWRYAPRFKLVLNEIVFPFRQLILSPSANANR